MLITWIQVVYQFLWGDLFRIPLPGGSSFGVSLLIILLIPTGIYFTIRTRFLPVRLFGDMVRALTGKKKEDGSLSTFQTLIVSTATRVGMGNLVGVVAAVSASVASINAVEEPMIAVIHIQNTAPAPPAETAATTPTRFPIPTLVAVETISV